MRVETLQGVGTKLCDRGLSKDQAKHFEKQTNHNEQLLVVATDVVPVDKTISIDVVSTSVILFVVALVVTVVSIDVVSTSVISLVAALAVTVVSIDVVSTSVILFVVALVVTVVSIDTAPVVVLKDEIIAVESIEIQLLVVNTRKDLTYY